jgi:hypothetical protein
MHGQYHMQLQAKDQIAIPLTYSWLKRAHLKAPTEALILAAQDQAINTNYHAAKIHKTQQHTRCRLCKAKDETIQHIVSGCSFLANGEYKRRHNNICEQLHWNILASHNLTKESHWWKHQPAPVIENENIKVLYDFDVRTDKVISARRPDIILVNKVRKTAQIIDVACPNDINVFEKEQEKVTKT